MDCFFLPEIYTCFPKSVKKDTVSYCKVVNARNWPIEHGLVLSESGKPQDEQVPNLVLDLELELDLYYSEIVTFCNVECHNFESGNFGRRCYSSCISLVLVVYELWSCSKVLFVLVRVSKDVLVACKPWCFWLEEPFVLLLWFSVFNSSFVVLIAGIL